jgi:hypothetical protein
MMSKALKVLQELKESAEYCVCMPGDVSARIDEAIQELLTQPELSTDSLQLGKPVAWRKNHDGHGYSFGIYNNGSEPLYTSPPKQEPMTDREISQCFRADKDATNAESYWAGVALAEKHYGIGVSHE